ncbi:hypothetical protein B0H10DRAFT_916959 [Mycena sp. CBHHK59/15]|nr:hypothetical protein B0H10DRAFT_916959 [Mycena sp. CBHHK59/15]
MVYPADSFIIGPRSLSNLTLNADWHVGSYPALELASSDSSARGFNQGRQKWPSHRHVALISRHLLGVSDRAARCTLRIRQRLTGVFSDAFKDLKSFSRTTRA